MIIEWNYISLRNPHNLQQPDNIIKLFYTKTDLYRKSIRNNFISNKMELKRCDALAEGSE